MDCIKKLDGAELEKWGEVMLQHSFDEEEWMEARISLIKLLSSEQKNAKENAIRSYLSCCAEAVGGTHPLPSLEESVVEFYKQYGMEGANEDPN